MQDTLAYRGGSVVPSSRRQVGHFLDLRSHDRMQLAWKLELLLARHTEQLWDDKPVQTLGKDGGKFCILELRETDLHSISLARTRQLNYLPCTC